MAHDSGLDDATLAGGYPGDELPSALFCPGERVMFERCRVIVEATVIRDRGNGWVMVEVACDPPIEARCRRKACLMVAADKLARSS